MDPYVLVRRVNSANRQETLQQLLPLTHLFAGLPTSFLREVIEHYSDKMSLWWNANSAKNCEVPSNEMVTFILQGKFWGIISKEFDGELSQEQELIAQGKDTSNKKVIIETLNRGKHFGDAMPPVGVYDEYDDKNFTISYYAESHEERLVCLQIEEQTLVDMINENPILASRMLTIYRERLKTMTEKVRRLSQMNSYERLRHYLFEIADEQNGQYRIDFSIVSQQTIADTIGCNRTTVTKELKYLEKNNWLIKIDKKAFEFNLLPLSK